MHSFTLSETFQKGFISAFPWVNPIPIWAYIPLGIPTPQGTPGVLHGYLLHFVGGKFSRTKVCDIYPLDERTFNFPNIAFLRLGPKLVQKHFGNISEMFHS